MYSNEYTSLPLVSRLAARQQVVLMATADCLGSGKSEDAAVPGFLVLLESTFNN